MMKIVLRYVVDVETNVIQFGSGKSIYSTQPAIKLHLKCMPLEDTKVQFLRLQVENCFIVKYIGIKINRKEWGSDTTIS